MSCCLARSSSIALHGVHSSVSDSCSSSSSLIYSSLSSSSSSLLRICKLSYVFVAFYSFLIDFFTSALAQRRRYYFSHTDSGCTLMGYRIWERNILSKAYCSSRMLILKSWSLSAESSRDIFKECVFNAQKAKIDANLNHILKLI